MSQKDRLPSGGRINRAIVLNFTFNGRKYQGYQGDTLASALLANGEHFVARSWKYHRPRGIVTAGVEEPNAIVQLETGAYTVPNARATEVELYQGLVATSVNAKPSIEKDRMAINQKFARFIPAGFYYKTFMWPRKFWPKYEEVIRDAAGLGKAPEQTDADRYDKCFAHCDVLVVGGGPTGLAAAHAAALSGARVTLIDDQPELGGSLLSCRAEIDGKPALQWVHKIEDELRQMPDVKILCRSTAFGYQDHNLITVTQRLTEHLPVSQRKGTRELMWKIRAKRVILATGAHERPIVFGNNDLPGVMLASAVSTYLHRYAVLPGRNAVVFTNNDDGYQCALDLKAAGAQVTVVDPRASESKGTLPALARRYGVKVMNGVAVTAAHGKLRVASVDVASYSNGQVGAKQSALPCDLLAMSGGWSPVLHLFAQSGGKAHWHDGKACFVPGKAMQAETSIGACAGDFTLGQGIRFAVDAGVEAARAAGHVVARPNPVQVAEITEAKMQPLWLVGGRELATRGPKQFVDFQNDVSAADIFLAAREGFESVEHVKRYTAMGFGTDQGKLGNINGMAILAQALGKTIPETGTTTFRPNYTPVTFGTFAGRELGEFLDPVRKTAVHEWHVENGAAFEDVGNWKRPWYFAKPGEDMHAAVAGGTHERRHPRRLDARQDRHSGPRFGEAVELGLHESVEQAGSRQVPLWPDARRKRHDLRRRRDRASRRPALHDDHHHRRRSARTHVARALAANRVAGHARAACFRDGSLGNLRRGRSEQPQGLAEGVPRHRLCERGVPVHELSRRHRGGCGVARDADQLLGRVGL
jgi:sarcosine oxidase subunit alpha